MIEEIVDRILVELDGCKDLEILKVEKVTQ